MMEILFAPSLVLIWLLWIVTFPFVWFHKDCEAVLKKYSKGFGREE